MTIKIKSKILSLKRRKSASNMQKAYVNGANRLFKDAIKAFLAAMMSSIAKDTGMTRATLLSIAARIRFKSAIEGQAAGGKIKPGHKSNYGFPVPSNIAKYKSKTFGERLGQKAYVLEIGTTSSPVFKFRFNLVTIQHIIHEDNWQSIDAGERAFLEFIQANKNNQKYFPSIKDWLINGRIIDGN